MAWVCCATASEISRRESPEQQSNRQDAKAAKNTKINKGTAETLRETRGRFNGKKRKDY
jgi:hypothetical protein